MKEEGLSRVNISSREFVDRAIKVIRNRRSSRRVIRKTITSVRSLSRRNALEKKDVKRFFNAIRE